MTKSVQPGESIQSAVHEIASAGGGRITLEPGLHRCGTLYLKSYVELHLVRGATLRGSTAPDDYDDFTNPGFDAFAPENSRKCLIAAANATDIAITGDGVIDGVGPAFYDTNVPPGEFFAKPPHPRPRMVQFYACRGVRVEGPSFVDSPGWTFWFIDCEDVAIHRIRVTGCQQMINNDGIDLDGCKRVTISDCFLRTGDDCIVVRAIPKQSDRPTISEQITVSNCTLDSWCQGVRVGCPGDDTVRNCTFSNLVITGKGRGIHFNNPKRYLKLRPDGFLNLHDISFTNIVIDTEREPVAINVESGIKLRRLSDIRFTAMSMKSPVRSRLEGCPETTISDVTFSHIRSNSAPEIEGCRNVVLNDFQIDATL